MCSLFSLIEQPTNIYLHGHNGLELFPADQRPQPWYTLDNLDNSKSNTYRQLSTLIHSFSFYSLSFTSRKGLEAALGMRQALDNKHSHSHLFTMGNLESLLHLYMAREDMQSPHRETSIGGRHQDPSHLLSDRGVTQHLHKSTQKYNQLRNLIIQTTFTVQLCTLNSFCRF